MDNETVLKTTSLLKINLQSIQNYLAQKYPTQQHRARCKEMLQQALSALQQIEEFHKTEKKGIDLPKTA